MDLARRNAEAVAETLKEMDARVRAQQIRIDGLVATMSGLLVRLEALERLMLLRRAEAAGHGPTAGE